MEDRVCINSLHFTFLIFSFIALVIVALNNFYKFSQCQNNNKQLMGLGEGILEPLRSLFTIPPAGPDPDTIDDLAVGELPPTRRDYRKLSDPLKQPSQRYTTYPTGGPVGGLFNVPTQGYYPSFQMMGFLNSPGDPDRMLKLYGRRTDKYNYEYYTAHHDDPELKIPLQVKGKKELMSGDSVQVPGFEHDFHVNLYDYEAPRYLSTVF